MGNRFCLGKGRKSRRDSEPHSDTTNESSPPPPVSVFYQACRDGNTDQVQQFLSSMSLNDINKIESNGSTAGE